MNSAAHRWKKKFPLSSNNDILELFEELINTDESNLIFVSILLGLIEKKLNKHLDNDKSSVDGDSKTSEDGSNKMFTINFNEIVPLYKSFVTFVSEIPIPKNTDKKFIDRSVLKTIADHIYLNLHASKQREICHSHSIYSFVNDNTLDSFGVAFTVVAIAQYLEYKGVRLALSEDHAWIEYDSDNLICTADVAWVGKDESKRCSPIDTGLLDRSRYYVQGYAVLCDSWKNLMAAAITTINPDKANQSSMNFYSHRNTKMNNHSYEVACLKRDLLWLCFKSHLLSSYPMALINLADLEFMYPTPSLPHNTPQMLYKSAVQLNRSLYENSHVYPYLSIGNYFYHHLDGAQYRKAVKCWRMAACVISNYNYKAEDWIIYREFFDIATTLLPQIFRGISSSANSIATATTNLVTMATHSNTSDHEDRISKSSDSNSVHEVVDINNNNSNSADFLKKDAEFLAEILLFFDFICFWEEGSSVPVLHEVWANKFKEVLLRFTEEARVKLGSIYDFLEGEDKAALCESICNPEGYWDFEKVLQLSKDENLEYLMNPVKTEQVVTLEVKQESKESESPSTIDTNHDQAKENVLSKQIMQTRQLFHALEKGENVQLASILSHNVLNLSSLLHFPTQTIDSNNNHQSCTGICTENQYAPGGGSGDVCEAGNLFDPNYQLSQINQSNDSVQSKSDDDEEEEEEDNKEKEKDTPDYFSTFKTLKQLLQLDKHQQQNVLQDLSNKVPLSSFSIDPPKPSSTSTPISRSQVDNQRNDSDTKNKSMLILSRVLKSQKMREIFPLIVAPGKLNVPAIKLALTAQSQVTLKRTDLHSAYGHHQGHYQHHHQRHHYHNSVPSNISEGIFISGSLTGPPRIKRMRKE